MVLALRILLRRLRQQKEREKGDFVGNRSNDPSFADLHSRTLSLALSLFLSLSALVRDVRSTLRLLLTPSTRVLLHGSEVFVFQPFSPFKGPTGSLVAWRIVFSNR